MFLVDSTIWIEYFNGVRSPHADYLDARLSKDLVLVGNLMLAEVLQGFRNEADFAKARDALMRLCKWSRPNWQRKAHRTSACCVVRA